MIRGAFAMRRLRLVLLLPFLLFAPAGPAAASDDAGAFIQDLAARVLPLLTDPAIPIEQRKTRFREVLNRDFDLDKIGKLVLGRHWRRAKPAKRKEFRKLLENYLSGLYARRFEDLAGLDIKVDGVRDFDGWSMVYTTATRTKGAPVMLDWRVDSKDG
ncbi:MAG: ABC transporter substrate-binding protein, partial [Alphaproteobacteria bacterium]|nr:ABC transporter substrate-binding protein [Alphaproteobacteria bacterium]